MALSGKLSTVLSSTLYFSKNKSSYYLSGIFKIPLIWNFLKTFSRFLLTELRKKKVYKQHLGGQNKSIHKFHLFTRRPDKKFLLQENTNHKRALWSKLYTRFISNNMSAHLTIIVFFVFFSFYTFLFLNACYFLTPLFVHFNFFYTSFLSNTVNKLT